MISRNRCGGGPGTLWQARLLLQRGGVRMAARLLLLTVLAAAFWTTPSLAAATGYQAGLEAYRQGDYELAFAEWIQIATMPAGTIHPGKRAETCFAIAMLYWIGQGVDQDIAAAARWLRQSAELNHAGAQSKLGYLYLQGDGVPKNEFEAFKWLQMAAQQGDTDAQYNLGVMYRDGRGIDADVPKALYWFEQAASGGDAVSAGIVADYQQGKMISAPLSVAIAPDGEVAMNREPAAGLDGPAGLASASIAAADSVAAGEQWILRRNPDHYTIQVMALTALPTLTRLIQGHAPWQPMAVYRQANKGKTLYVLVQGDYPDVESARISNRDFPRSLQHPARTWIRQFGKVQALIETTVPADFQGNGDD